MKDKIRSWLQLFRAQNENLRYCKVIPKLDDEETVSYIVGALLGDGNLIKVKSKICNGHDYQIRLKSKDEEFIQSFAMSLRRIGLRPYITKIRLKRKNPNWSNCWEVRVRSKSFYYFLKTLDFTTLGKSYRCLIAFLKGLFEAEGCFNPHRYFDKRRRKLYTKYIVDISNNNLALVMFVAQLLKDLGFHPWIRTVRNKSGTINYRVCLSRKDEVKRFLEAINPCIPRKKWQEIGCS